MSTKFLTVSAFLFFISWKRTADDFLLFCSLFAVGLWVCNVIYRSERVHTAVDDETA